MEGDYAELVKRLERSGGDEKGGGCVADTDSSVSLLELPPSISGISGARAGTSEPGRIDSCFPESIDPVFVDHYLVFPQALSETVCRMRDRGFVYKMSEERELRIVRCKDHETVYCLGVIDLEKDEIGASSRGVSVVMNRSRLRALSTAKENKEYRHALSEGKRYVRRSSGYESKVREMHLAQIRSGRNFIFVESPEDLHRELKAIMGHLHSKKTRAPRTKTFSTAQRTDHLQSVLQSIPGVGRGAARSLSTHFKSIRGLYLFLRSDGSEALKEFKVWDEDGKHCRRLGERQHDRIRNAFIEGSGRL